MRNSRRLVVWLIWATLFSLALPASAERKWVEPPAPAPVTIERPSWPASHPALCSDRRPLCVHTENDAAILAPALRALEEAHARVVDVLGWPAPQSDFGLGPNPAFDVYLVPSSEAWIVRPDPLTDTSLYPRTNAFAYVDLSTVGSCRLPYAMSAALVRAGIFAIDAAANDDLANASAAYLASIVEPCAVAFVADLDDFQANPQLAVSNPAHHRGRGAMLFPWYLQSARGRGAPADLLHALWVLSAQKSVEDSAILLNEPDFVDATEILASDVRRSLTDLWLDFAVSRAFTGDRDDGIHVPETRFLGSAGAVRFEWSIPYNSLPRRLAPLHPIEPTGASFVWLSLDAIPKDAGLGFRADWEPPDVFRFSLVLVDDKGQAISRHDPVSPERGTTAQANIETLTGAAGVIIVACNTGSVLRDIAFDPDNMPYTPRGYTVSLFAQ
jgi:hypothetical protein